MFQIQFSFSIALWRALALAMLCTRCVATTTQDVFEPPSIATTVNLEHEATLARRDGLWGRAQRLSAQGKQAKAVLAGEQVLKLERELFGREHRELTGTLPWLAQQYLELHNLEKAQLHAAESLRVLEALHGSESRLATDGRWYFDYVKKLSKAEPDTLTAIRAIKSEYDRLYEVGEYAAAAEQIAKLICLEEPLLGSQHPNLASSFVLQATCLIADGNFAEAEAASLKALEIRRNQLGDQDPGTAEAAFCVASSLTGQNKYDPSRVYWEQARDSFRKCGQSADAALVDKVRGVYLTALDKNDEAMAAFLESLSCYEGITDEEGVDALQGDIANLAIRIGDWALAEKVRLKQADKAASRYGKAHDRAINAQLAVSHVRRLASLNAAQRKLLDKADKDFSEIRQLLHAGETAKAIGLAKSVQEARQSLLGEWHPNNAISLNNLAILHMTEEEYAEAEKTLLRAKEIFRVTLGEKHYDHINCTSHLALLYIAKEDYSTAEQLLKKILSLRRNVVAQRLSNGALVYASCLNSLFAYDESEAFRKIFLRLSYWEFRRTKHKDHAEAMLAIARYSDWVEGESTNLEKALGRLVAQSLASEDLPTAESRLYELLSIKTERLGETHHEVASTRLMIAHVHRLAALTPEQRQRLRQAEGHKEQIETRRLAGEYETALLLSRQISDELKELLGEDDLKYVENLKVRALLHFELKEFAEAEEFLSQALTIGKKVYGEHHPAYTYILADLAGLFHFNGDYAQASVLYSQLLELREKFASGEPSDFLLTRCLGNLANVHKRLANYTQAEQLYLRLLPVLAYGSYDYAETCFGLADLHRTTRDFARAAPLYSEAVETSLQILEQWAVHESEREQLASGQLFRHHLDNYISFSLDAGQYRASAALDVLRWKGATLVRQRAMRLAADDPAIADRFQELQKLSRGLASLSRVTPKLEPPGAIESWQARIGDLTAQRERLEAQLSSESAVFRGATQEVTLEQIQKSLPPDGVLIDYLQFIRSRPAEPRGGFASEESLLATIVLPQGVPILVELGPLAPITAAIETWRQTFGMSAEGKAAGSQLRQLVWEPVLAKLVELDRSRLTSDGPQAESAEISHKSFADGTLLISTDGVLGRLPLSGLPGKDPGTYLIEDHRLAMVPVPQLLPALVNNQDRKELTRELLLLGDVDYDADPVVAAKEPSKRPRRAVEADQPFSPLEGTRGEIATIKKTYTDAFELNPNDVETLERASATEVRFRELAPQFYHLHLATHGFFAPESMLSALTPHEAEHSGSGRVGLASEDMQVRGYNPGLLSGLAFAGANRPPVDDADDGILTAQEIAFMPLGGVDTVVLSACETGLGNKSGGEGLLGVQRAFQIAGVRTTVASFWKVDDFVTRILMERFYRNLWQEEMPRLDALREAQIHVLNNPVSIRGAKLEETTESQRVPPYFWAAFTLAGDWR